MDFVRRAVIDVGTNSVKLLVADVHGREVRPVVEMSHQTRLGEGFYENHRLQPGPIAMTAAAVAEFVGQSRKHQAVTLRLIATSAARDAVNPEELVIALEGTAGIRPEIISGEQEADWAFQGVTSDPALAHCPLLLLEVGGGSSQFILGQGPMTHFRQSFQVGTVRLLERIPHSDPPQPKEMESCRTWLRHWLQTDAYPQLEPALRREVALDPAHGAVTLVGAGGTASILARIALSLEDFDRDKLESVRLTAEELQAMMNRLWSLPLAARKKVAGLPPNRADVILNGAAIYEAVMREFRLPKLRVSTRGLRFGALLSM